MNQILEAAFRVCGVTDRDFKRGFADVICNGESLTIRITRLAPTLQSELLRRYAAAPDTAATAAAFVLPMLPKNRQSDAFINSLEPGSLAKLSTAAVALSVSRTTFKQFVDAIAGNLGIPHKRD